MSENTRTTTGSTVEGDVITYWPDNMKDFRLSVSVNVKSTLVENSLSLRLFK